MNNEEYKINNLLIIDNIKLSNINFSQEKYEIKDYNLEIIIKKKNEEIYSIEIKNLNDFGLILDNQYIFYGKIKNDKICDELYKIWNKITKKIGINEKNSSLNFPLFINSLIERRNNNVFNWLKQITYFTELKQRFNNKSSPLNGIWNICDQQCKECFNNCYLLLNHEGVHKCFYDHKCKQKCQLCSEIKAKCKEEKCEKRCTVGMSHPVSFPHSCNHKHHCDKICDLKNNTTNCRGKCILHNGHK